VLLRRVRQLYLTLESIPGGVYPLPYPPRATPPPPAEPSSSNFFDLGGLWTRLGKIYVAILAPKWVPKSPIFAKNMDFDPSRMRLGPDFVKHSFQDPLQDPPRPQKVLKTQ